MSTISKNIKNLRKANGETQTDLAAAINVTDKAIANYEAGIRLPDIEKTKDIAEHYGIPVDRLMNEDFSMMDFNLSSLTWEKAMEIVAVQFPIVSSEDALRNSDFAEGYYRTQKIWSKIKEGQSNIMRNVFEYALQKYEDAIISNNSVEESVANVLWLTFMIYGMMPDEHSYKMGEAILFGKSLEHNFVKNYVLKDSNPISEENAGNKRNYVIDSEETVVELIRILKKSEKYADLADYYTALRYVIGMIANDYSDDLNKTIGMEMLISFAELGNKYVMNYLRAIKNI